MAAAAPAIFTPQVTAVGSALNDLLIDSHEKLAAAAPGAAAPGADAHKIEAVQNKIRELKTARDGVVIYKSIFQILKFTYAAAAVPGAAAAVPGADLPPNHIAYKFNDPLGYDLGGPVDISEVNNNQLNNIVKSMNVHLVDYLLDNLVNSYTTVTNAIDAAAAADADAAAAAAAKEVALKFAREFSIFKKGVERLVGPPGADTNKVINPTSGTKVPNLDAENTVAYTDGSIELAAINAFIPAGPLPPERYAGGNGIDYSTKVLNTETSQQGGSDVGNLAEIYNTKSLITDDHSPSSVIGSADVNSVQYAPAAFSAGMSLSQDLAGGIAVEDSSAAAGGSVHEILSPVSVQSAGGAGKNKKTSHKKKNAGSEEITKAKKKKKSVSKK